MFVRQMLSSPPDDEGPGKEARIAKEGAGKDKVDMVKSCRRFVALWVAVAGLTFGSAAYAHENHNELGAGPGPAVEETAPAVVGTAPAMADMHENMAMGHEEAATAHEEAADANKTFGQRLVSWLGRLHPFGVHFPIAMFIGALAVELYGLWKRNTDYQRAAFIMLVIGALGAVVAAALGWFAGGFYLTDRNPILMIHRWLGTAIALIAIGFVYLSGRAIRRPDRPRTAYWVLLGLMTVAIVVQGYLGASFMHGGMDHGMF